MLTFLRRCALLAQLPYCTFPHPPLLFYLLSILEIEFTSVSSFLLSLRLKVSLEATGY